MFSYAYYVLENAFCKQDMLWDLSQLVTLVILILPSGKVKKESSKWNDIDSL